MNAGDQLLSECKELEEISGAHLSENGDDALYVFLRVHNCICVRLERDPSFLALKSLNELFARRVLNIYANVRSSHFSPCDVSYRWTSALCAYLEAPHWYALVLPLMAKAHILDDLPECLHECLHETATEDITRLKKDYDAVLDVIIECLDNVLIGISKDSIARSAQSLLLNNPLGGIAIQYLRKRGWTKFEKMRGITQKLNQKWPKPSGDI